MNLSDFDYPLPKELIAQKPLDKRDSSRLLVADRKAKTLTDKVFSDIAEYFEPGDVLVLNNSKVFPARLLGKKKKTEGKVDVLLLTPTEDNKNIWRCLVQPSLKDGQEIIFDSGAAEAKYLTRGKDGVPLIEFYGQKDVRTLAEIIGSMPLPPYIKREAGPEDRDTYQTVYAEIEGAVAAPTAGLHFTKELLKKIEERGVGVLSVTLHVGYGTFKPVEDLENHVMHSERFELTAEVADRINEAKSKNHKVWAVGTTALRVLETCVQYKQMIPGRGDTDLYIKAPFEFEAVDHLITNFHLPKTTLLLLVSAFMGEDLRKQAYDHAIASHYRFYSYGDAMLVV